MTDKPYQNQRDCEHGCKRGSCQLCDYEQEISELTAERDNLLSIVEECRSKVLSAQFRAEEYTEQTGEDGDYAVILSQLVDRIDAAIGRGKVSNQ